MLSNTRRALIQGMAVIGGSLLQHGPLRAAEATRSIDSSPQVQPALPYAANALEPVISARTVDFHYSKHHKAYFSNLAKLVAGTAFAHSTLEDIIAATAGRADHRAIFNNAAQAWNHNLYWQSLSPGATTPSPALAAAIARDFGSEASLIAELAKASIGQFGSGWGWLVMDGPRLEVVSTSNADNPMAVGKIPLLVIDVWEHAYYLDDQNRRGDYVEAVARTLLNWKNASQRFARATGSAEL